MQQKESGHAGILFVIMLTVLWGITAVTLDSSRGIQAKVRLDEAVDQAVIAVSARPVSNYELDDALIGDYITSFISDAHNVEPKLTLEDCSEDVPNSCTRYEVTARAEIDTWFLGGKTITGFDEQMPVAGVAKAEKITAVANNDSVALDVMFVADTSGSMGETFGGAESRIDALQKVFSNVIFRLDAIDKKNDDPDKRSTFGYVPFTNTYYTFKGSRACAGNEVSKQPDYPWHWNLAATVEQMFQQKSGCDNEIHPSHIPFYNFEISPTTDYNSIDVSQVQPRNGGTIPIHSFIRGVQLLKQGKNKQKLFILVTDGQIDNSRDNESHIALQRDYKWCDIMRNELSKDGVNLTFVGMTIQPDYDTRWFDLCFGEENTYETNDLDDFFDALDEVMVIKTSTDIGHYIK
ncbi:TPA: hypothetical protein ACGUPU_002810 [Vibrio vulnificus]